MATRLRFYARGTALVADVHAQEHAVKPTRRFIGRRWQEVVTGTWAWCPKEEPEDVEYHHDLARACKDGDLWPADEETAVACGVSFDPEFGGEETETIRAWKARTAPTPVAKKTTEKSEKTAEKTFISSGKGDL